MTVFWQWCLGIKQAAAELQGGEWRLEFRALPEGGWAVALLALALGAAAGVWYLYRKEGRNLGVPLRLLLATLRMGILAAVAFMLFELELVIVRTDSVPAHVLVLMDVSQSLSIGDPYPDDNVSVEMAVRSGAVTSSGQPDLAELRRRSRLELARTAVDKILPELAEDRVLDVYAFDSQLRELNVQPAPQAAEEGSPSPGADAPPPPPALPADLVANGTQTGIGDAVQAAIKRRHGQPLAGVLVVSDGRSNVGQPLSEVAAELGRVHVPVHTLLVGSDKPPRNLRLADLEVSPVIFVRDPIEMTVITEARGMKDAAAAVVLEQLQDDGSWKELARQDIKVAEDSVLQKTTFPYTPETVGQSEFRARAIDAGPEFKADDNQQAKTVRVVRQGIRVLLIAGYASPEMQFMRNALLRDAALEFASWLQNAGEGYEHVGHRPLRRLPNTQKELDRYDVLVLFDPDMKALGPNWPEMIAKFVGTAGGGLVYVSGELHSQNLFASDPALNPGADNSWLKILPVVRDPGLFQSAADVRLSSRDTFVLELTPEGGDDAIFRFDPDAARNREVLASLPGMYWHFPVTRAKPGATVLARHGDPRMKNQHGRHVLMASQMYGPGRSVFLGFDSTYRWRYLSEAFFDGFWARLIDRVGRNKVLGGRYPFTVATDKVQYRSGDRVTVRAQLVESGESRSELGDLQAEWERGSDPPEELEFESPPGERDRWEGSFVAEKPGQYTLRVKPVTAVDVEGGLRPATVQFTVESPKAEFDNPVIDRESAELAARLSGGQVFTLVDAASIPAAFKLKSVPRVLEFHEEIWDAPLLCGALVTLLTIEWVLRKKFRMA